MAAEVQPDKPKYVHKKCEHGKQKYFCKDCGGKGWCIHDKLKHNCNECSISFCNHGKEKYYCKDCGGKGWCEHNKIKKDCITCKGSSICEHNKRKRTCIDCKGSLICLHNTRKSICRICIGSSICIHTKIKDDCIICTPKNGCQLCHHIFIKHSRWKPYCFRCYCVLNPDVKIPRQFKLKEHYVMDALKAHYKDTLTMAFDKTIEGGCSKKRPDLFIDFGSHCLIIEVDENRHVNYVCERKRMISLYEDLGFRKVIFLRFNPDGYTEQSVKHISPFGYTPTGMIKINTEEMSRRIEILITKIEEYRKEPDDILTILHLFYGD
jgi:hypothetical protein